MVTTSDSNEKNVSKGDLNARCTYPHHLMTDFERFIGHENFGFYLFLVFATKAIRQSLIAGTVPNSSEVLTLLGADASARQGEDELDQTVRYIQSQCIESCGERSFIRNIHFVPRGKFPEIDGLIDESIKSLRMEFKRCMAWYCDSSSSKSLTNSAARATRTKQAKTGGRRGKKGKSEAIAVKYSKEQTDTLNAWMIENVAHPFPNITEINELGKATDLNYSQVVNWTTNVRKRNLKATVEKGKKPHHFLDFLFLADHKERVIGNAVAPVPAAAKVTRNKRNSSRKSASRKQPVLRKPAKASASTSSKKLAAAASSKLLDTHFQDMNCNAFSNFDWSLTGINPDLVTKVTPPRINTLEDAPLNLDIDTLGDNPCPQLPAMYPLDNWQGIGNAMFEEKSIFSEITKEDLISTPERRDSDGTFSMDVNDPQLMASLANIFKERENTEAMDTEEALLDSKDFSFFMNSDVALQESEELEDCDMLDFLGDNNITKDKHVEV